MQFQARKYQDFLSFNVITDETLNHICIEPHLLKFVLGYYHVLYTFFVVALISKDCSKSGCERKNPLFCWDFEISLIFLTWTSDCMFHAAKLKNTGWAGEREAEGVIWIIYWHVPQICHIKTTIFLTVVLGFSFVKWEKSGWDKKKLLAI